MSSDRPSAPEEPYEHQYYGYGQEYVDEPTERDLRDEPQQPEYADDRSDCEQHDRLRS